MAENRALWSDIDRDLGVAETNAAQAGERAASLRSGSAALSADSVLDREYAIGVMLHNAYGAMESALERLILAVDGGLPTGPGDHTDLLRRAGAPIPGLRPEMITAETEALLQRLRAFRHVFRHAYGTYDYERAEQNVAVAATATARLRCELAGFAEAAGILAGTPPP